MKIVVTSQGDNLKAKVEPRFGRSPYFIIFDTSTNDFEAIKNSNLDAASGVGIQSGQLMADKKVKAVLTGKMGPKASETLEAAGIEIVTGVSGTIQEAIEQYQSDKLKPTNNEPQQDIEIKSQDDARGEGNWFSNLKQQVGRGLGMGQGRGSRQGRGMGRGQGSGMGQGRGMGRGQGAGRKGFAGPSGYCICPNCGEKIVHQRGVPCRSQTCAKCGSVMVRE